MDFECDFCTAFIRAGANLKQIFFPKQRRPPKTILFSKMAKARRDLIGTQSKRADQLRKIKPIMQITLTPYIVLARNLFEQNRPPRN